MPIESGRIQFRKSCVSEINRFKRVNRTGFFSFYCMCAMLCLPFGHAARYHHYKLSGKRHKFYFMTTNRRSKFYLYALVCVCVYACFAFPSFSSLVARRSFVCCMVLHSFRSFYTSWDGNGAELHYCSSESLLCVSVCCFRLFCTRLSLHVSFEC